MEKKSALVAGASGLVGTALLTCLLESQAYEKVKVFVRNRIDIESPKLDQIVVDFDKLEEFNEHFKVDDVFCCLGTTIKKAGSKEAFRKVDFEYPVHLGKLAKKNGVQRFLIITALGADKDSKIFYSRVKGETEVELKSIGLTSLHIFQPSLLLGERKEFRLGEKLSILLSPLVKPILAGGLRKYQPIKAQDVALAMSLIAQTQLTGIYTYQYNDIMKINERTENA
jgi:uncharacterized protein YbjT (DUF2867 family)